MVRTDLHFFSSDALPLILQFLRDRGFKHQSYRAVPCDEVRNVESTCPDNCVTIKVKYNV